jgi:hypothetical protein
MSVHPFPYGMRQELQSIAPKRSGFGSSSLKSGIFQLASFLSLIMTVRVVYLSGMMLSPMDTSVSVAEPNKNRTKAFSKTNRTKEFYERKRAWLKRNGPRKSKAILAISTKETPSIPKPDSEMNLNRTAIVWVCQYLNECGAERLRHLLVTAGAATTHKPQDNTTLPSPTLAGRSATPRDIWVMHHHSSLKTNSSKRDNSDQLIKNLTTFAKTELGIDLHVTQQHNNKWNGFDSTRSGTGKSSFLRFLVENQYGLGWHVEDDLFYTGKWHEVFDQDGNNYTDHRGNDSIGTSYDILASGRPAANDWYHFKQGKCLIRNPGNTGVATNRRYKKCEEVAKFMTRWGIIRVSQRFARTLVFERDKKRYPVTGHHEAVVAGFCKSYQLQCSFDGLDSRIGNIVTAGWGEWKNATTQSLERHAPIQPNKIYHPCKCAAYTGENLTVLLDQLVY